MYVSNCEIFSRISLLSFLFCKAIYEACWPCDWEVSAWTLIKAASSSAPPAHDLTYWDCNMNYLELEQFITFANF